MDGNQILPIALASVPTMLTVLVGILINNSRLSDVNVRISELRSTMDERIGEMGSGLGALQSSAVIWIRASTKWTVASRR